MVRQNPMERNFHIFYAMLAGSEPDEKKELKLGDPAAFHYLNQSGCVSDPTINDEEDFKRVRVYIAMNTSSIKLQCHSLPSTVVKLKAICEKL